MRAESSLLFGSGKECSFLERRLGHAPFEEVETHVASCIVCQGEVEWMWQFYHQYGEDEMIGLFVFEGAETKDEFLEGWHRGRARRDEAEDIVAAKVTRSLRDPEVGGMLRRIRRGETAIVLQSAKKAPPIVLSTSLRLLRTNYRKLYHALGDAAFWEYIHGSPMRPTGTDDLELFLSWWEQVATTHYTDADRAWVKENAPNI